jgi:YXWGXW repeat-containing protein
MDGDTHGSHDQLEVRIPPPPPHRETIPPPRAGYVWIPGYWDWRNARHSWVVGRWAPERRGCHWKPHRWVSRNGRWFLQVGGWTPDVVVDAAARAGASGLQQAAGQD